MTKSQYVRLACILGPLLIADQITKALVRASIPLYTPVPVIPGFFDLNHIQNPGGLFGFLSDQSRILQKIVFGFFSALAAGLILYFYKKTPPSHPFLATGFALILAGAIGNLIDRIRFGRVVDFLDVYVGNYHWPVFNVADSAISVGMGVFIFHVLFNKMPR